MRSFSACEVLVAASVAATGALTTRTARADEKAVCATAYDQTQTLRAAGKLQAAHEQALVCTRDACAAFVRTDCARWLGEIETAQPSVVFVAKDAGGHELSAVRVSLDGRPWPASLDGRAQPVDPGAHALRFEATDYPAIDQTVVIREGEKDRRIEIAFGSAAAPLPLLTPPPPLAVGAPVATAPPATRSSAPWIVGGMGVAGLIVGAVTGALVLADKSSTNTHCDPSTQTCDADGRSASSAGRTLGPVCTTSLIVGAVGIGASAVLFATRTDGAANLTVSASASPSVSGLRVQGAF